MILRDTIRLRGKELTAAHGANLKALTKMARTRKDGRSKLLGKVVGDLDHEGEQQLKPGSTGFRILERFVQRVDGKVETASDKRTYTPPPFFDGVEMLDDRRLLRRLTLSLAGRLPTRFPRSAAGTRKAADGQISAIIGSLIETANGGRAATETMTGMCLTKSEPIPKTVVRRLLFPTLTSALPCVAATTALVYGTRFRASASSMLRGRTDPR